MGLFDKAGKLAEKAGEKMAKAATGVADKSKVLAEKTKLKSNINSENSNINKAYTALGKKYFEVSGANPAAEYEEIVDSIKSSMQHIEQLQQQIAALDTDSTCPKCGVVMRKDQQFCQSCGARQDNFVDVSPADVEVVSEVENTTQQQNHQ